MPSYSMSEYGYEKLRINPANRGYWDLKNTGQYHKGITVRYKHGRVEFYQKYQNAKIDWLHRRLELFDGSIASLGITKDQIKKVEIENIPNILPKLVAILQSK